jgi:hypothetical protein
VIPYFHGQTLYYEANPPKKFLNINGEHMYGFVLSRDIYVGGLREFFEEFIPGYAEYSSARQEKEAEEEKKKQKRTRTKTRKPGKTKKTKTTGKTRKKDRPKD